MVWQEKAGANRAAATSNTAAIDRAATRQPAPAGNAATTSHTAASGGHGKSSGPSRYRTLKTPCRLLATDRRHETDLYKNHGHPRRRPPLPEKLLWLLSDPSKGLRLSKG